MPTAATRQLFPLHQHHSEFHSVSRSLISATVSTVLLILLSKSPYIISHHLITLYFICPFHLIVLLLPCSSVTSTQSSITLLPPLHRFLSLSPQRCHHRSYRSDSHHLEQNSEVSRTIPVTLPLGHHLFYHTSSTDLIRSTPTLLDVFL